VAQGYVLVVPIVEDSNAIHRVAFYVDYRYRVRILDNGVVRELVQFDDCPTQFQKLESEAIHANDSYYHGITLSLGTIRHGVTFNAESYEVFVSETSVSITTNHAGEYRISSNCSD
jgi:hypothetical protein